MAEFIGARISLVSKSDIRYIGTLHEINSETSTVALENVTSFGTEGRRNNTEEEIPPSESIYEYIVFRGTDVKDLRIEETPVQKENKQPQVPNDPAILGSGSRPPPAKQAQAPPRQNQTPSAPSSAPPSAPQGPQAQQQQQPPQQQQQHGPPPPGPPFGQHPGYPSFYPPPPGNWGRGGPPGPGFPGMPYGAPPGWYPPPGQGFPPGPFPPYGFSPGPPGQHFQQQQQTGLLPKPAPIGPGANKQQASSPAPSADKQADSKSFAKPAAEIAAAAATKAPTPSAASKHSQDEVKAAIEQPSASQSAATAATSKAALSLPKNNGRVQPAIPLASPAAAKAPLQTQSGNVTTPPAAQPTPASLRDATQAATAAVAAAMAKLPPTGQANGTPMDNLTRKVAEMRTTDPIRAPRQPGSAGGSGFAPGRGGRGRGGTRNSNQKVEVPEADFDFASSNAKFNKQDLVKEAIAGSPLGEEAPISSPTEPDAPVGYNKSTSFFDNISSESKDRAEAGNGRPGGREWRGEEQKKNVETFGQGSVDNGYRGGYRGRGRGRGGHRGRGYGGNGQPGRGRGGYRGRGDQTMVQ